MSSTIYLSDLILPKKHNILQVIPPPEKKRLMKKNALFENLFRHSFNNLPLSALSAHSSCHRWQLKVPPGWELPPSPLISTKDPRRVI